MALVCVCHCLSEGASGVSGPDALHGPCTNMIAIDLLEGALWVSFLVSLWVSFVWVGAGMQEGRKCGVVAGRWPRCGGGEH
jgi:hypothetical protein